MLGFRIGSTSFLDNFRQEQHMERRRVKIVDQFQRKLAVRMIVYWLIYQLTLFNFLFCWRLLSEGSGNLLEQYGRFVADYWPIIICFLIVVPALAWDAMKFCHRVAGPIVRFRQISRDIALGKPVRRIKLRDGDELMELQKDFNAMLDRLAADHAIELVAPGSSKAAAADPVDDELADELLATNAE
jgi:hypothetical protein